MILAYIDLRPFLFVIGLPVVILLALLGCWIAKARIVKWKAVLFSTATFAALFGFFLYGPFIGQTETREHIMTWKIEPTRTKGINEPKVILSFVEFPSYFIGGYSDEIATHLKKNGEEKVNVVFEITSDYGKVRGYRETEIAGLKSWRWIDDFGGSSGSPERSPWD
jgi:hypothetical protein